MSATMKSKESYKDQYKDSYKNNYKELERPWSEVKQNIHDDLLQEYDTHIQELVGITRSDMRNIKQLKSEQINQEDFFEKIF